LDTGVTKSQEEMEQLAKSAWNLLQMVEINQI
jgi:hypothetical protein